MLQSVLVHVILFTDDLFLFRQWPRL